MSSGTDRQGESQDMNGDKNQNFYDKSNGNHEMLNFNDNYAMILQKLANDNSHLLTEDFSPNAMGVGSSANIHSDSSQNNLNNNNNPNFSGDKPSEIGSGGNGEDRQNLDALLQHYQSLLTRSSAQYPGSNAGTLVGNDNYNTSNDDANNNRTNGGEAEGSFNGNNTRGNLNGNNTNDNRNGNSNNGGNNNTNNDDINNRNDSNSTNNNNNNKSMITERPCDHCRRRQTKCVLVPDLADCVQCETKGIKCTFSDLPNKPNKFMGVKETMNSNGKHQRQDNGVDLEGLLKRAKTNNNDNVAQYYTELLQNLNETMNNNTNPNTNINNGNNSNISTNVSSAPTPGLPHNNSFTNLIQQQQHPLASAPSAQPRQYFPSQPTGQYPRSSLYVGPTSAYDLNLVNHVKLDNIDQIQLSPSVSLRKVAPDVLFVLRDNFNEQVFLKQEQEVDMVERLVYPHGKVLIDIFFKLIHPCFPILHERVFLEKYSRSYRELTAPLLASIYSLSIQWWDFHPKLIGFPKPDVVEQLNEIAYRTFFQMIERPKLSIVQTGLLMLQCRSEYPNNWVLCSALVALCEELGLGIDCQDWRLPRWERGLRRRLAWAVWIQEKWTALVESRNSHLILGRNWMVKMLTEEDFPQNSPVISASQDSISRSSIGPEASLGNISLIDMSPTDADFVSGNLMFQQLVSLTVILGEIMDTFYTEGAVKVTTRIEQVLKLAKPLQLKLREWYHSLPSQLSMNKFVPRKFNPNATLTLAYFAAEITLHRKIISTLRLDTPKELVQVCRTAAKTRLVAAIEFVRDLKSEHINAFWYTCSTGNLMLIAIFAALLYVTAQTRDEAIVVRDYLRNYIWILRVGSKSFDRSGNALKRIHILLSQIPGLLTDDQPREFVPTRSQSPMYPATQQWKIPAMMTGPSSMESQQMSPNLNQLRGVPAEILQNLTGLSGGSPSFPLNRGTAQSSPLNLGGDIGGGQGPHTYPSTNESEHGVKVSSDRSNTSPKDGQLVSREGSFDTEHPSPGPLADPSSAGSTGKNMVDPTTLTQNPRGKPITPQSVNGNNITKDNTPGTSSEALEKSTTTGSSASVSPSSIRDKEDRNGATNEDMNQTSPENVNIEDKDEQNHP